uniref:Caspase family p20 domain-containing protein n=1 Tax=Scylla olivacea TaxID=85551 RepID=A0A0P4W7R0_SCYOL
MASRSEGIMPVTESDVNQNLPLCEDSSPEAVQISNLDDNGESSQRKQVPLENMVPDDSDARWMGCGQPMKDIRPQAAMSVGRDADFYKMDHKKRGQAIIFVHDQFDDINLQPRTCAKHDTAITRHAFEHLSFEVKEHWNLKKRDFLATLQEVSSENHHNSDCLVVVFMSHGNVNNNKEFLCTRDFKVDTEELWKNFTADKCPSLAGKPKLFFIQACRGDNIDKGVKMKNPKALNVQVDCMHRKEDYVIPLHADMLMMWASYPGMFAFKSYQNDINGSVFIHFLSKVLIQDGRTCDLFTLLLRVTREVATRYESYTPQSNLLHQNKQTPYMVSTLMRKLVFPVWKS